MHNYGTKPTIQTSTDIHGTNTQAVAGNHYRFASQDATFQFPDAIPNVAPFGSDDFEIFMLEKAKAGFVQDGRFSVDYAEITCTKVEQVYNFPVIFNTKYTFNADVYVTCLHNPFVIDDLIVILGIIAIIGVIIAIVAYTWTWTSARADSENSLLNHTRIRAQSLSGCSLNGKQGKNSASRCSLTGGAFYGY